MSLESGHNWTPLSYEENAEQAKLFKSFTEGLIRLDPGNWLLTSHFLKFANRYYNFKFKPTDFVIMGFPKSGTTWTQEITWTMIKNSGLSNPQASLPSQRRVHCLDFDPYFATKNGPHYNDNPAFQDFFKSACPGKTPGDDAFFDIAEAAPDPRIMKTHLSFTLLHPDMLDTCKVIFVSRDPRDVCTSFHNYSVIAKPGYDYVGTFDQYVDLFAEDKVKYAPFWEHKREALERINHPNLHFLYYEDLKNNTKSEYKRLSQFLNVDLTDENLDKIIQHTSFEEMKKREKLCVNPEEGDGDVKNTDISRDFLKTGVEFFRKGEAQDWKHSLTEEQIRKLNKWIERNKQKQLNSI